MADVLFNSDPGIITLSGEGIFGLYILSEPGTITLSGGYALNISGPPPSWNPNLDYTYYCNDNQVDGIGQGVGVVTLSGIGNRLEVHVVSSPGIINLSGYGLAPGWVLINSSPGVITISGKGDAYLILIGDNWVWWSEIGNLSFDLTKSNIAGRRPMNWRGWVYQIKKLGNQVIVYGENGISTLVPATLPMENNAVISTFGFKSLHPIGLKSKNAVTGTEEVQYFVDKAHHLWMLSKEGLKDLNYSEYLSVLSSKLVLSYDPHNELVYMSDGSYGFVYSNSGLGQSPNNITGIGIRTGTLYITATATITNSPLSECTDILDFGFRTDKTLVKVEVGIDVSQDVYVAVDYRRNKNQAFTTSSWVKVNSRGEAFFILTGVEFRIRFKLTTYEYIRLDYFNVILKVPDDRKMVNA